MWRRRSRCALKTPNPKTPPSASKPRKRAPKAKEPRERPVSLHPLSFEEVVRGLLQVKPDEPLGEKRRQEQPEREE